MMWVMVMFDLPVATTEDRRNYTRFRNSLLDDGFIAFQFSIYLRHCPSAESAQVHINRVKDKMPAKGQVGIFRITDKQYQMLELYHGAELASPPGNSEQLMLF